MKIRVTGIGVVSSAGLDAAQCLEAFRSGHRGLGPMQILDSVHRDDFPVGEVGLDNAGLALALGLDDGRGARTSRTAMLGMLAARQALESAGIGSDELEGMALVSATTVGGMDRTEKAYAAGEDPADYLAGHPCGDTTDRIAAYLGLTSYRTTLSTACSSGANALLHAAGLIRQGRARRVLAGGVDALSRFTLNGFNSLMILDRELCSPFDKERRGLNLGEGAGFLLLESDEALHERGATALCSLAGYANTNDAYHQTASSPEGDAATMAMQQALAMAGLEAGQIDYVNVHGTGTENNDASEGAALLRVFGDRPPAFSSTKSYTGHTLGAAAGLEAVFSVLAIREGMIIPSMGWKEPMDERLRPETGLREGVEINHVLSNSFGFGGNNSTLIFSKD